MITKNTTILRKGKVVAKVQNFKYLVEDLLDNEIIIATLNRSAKMAFPLPTIGEEMYVLVSLFASTKGQIITSTMFERDRYLSKQKIKLDSKCKLAI